MATAVVQRDDFAARTSVNNDRPLQNGPGQLLAVDQFVIPGRNVPGVAQKNSVLRHHTLRIRGTLSFYSFLIHWRCRGNRNFLEALFTWQVDNSRNGLAQ